MRRDECTFKEAYESLTQSEWSEIYLYARKRTERFLDQRLTRREEILVGANAGLYDTDMMPEISGSDDDYVQEATIYYCRSVDKRIWTIDEIKTFLVVKARNLVRDAMRKRRRGNESIGDKAGDYDAINEEWAEADALRQHIRGDGSQADLDALRFFQHCLLEDTATTWNPLKRRTSFKIKVIAEALGWGIDRTDRARTRFLEKARSFGNKK